MDPSESVRLMRDAGYTDVQIKQRMDQVVCWVVLEGLLVGSLLLAVLV